MTVAPQENMSSQIALVEIVKVENFHHLKIRILVDLVNRDTTVAGPGIDVWRALQAISVMRTGA